MSEYINFVFGLVGSFILTGIALFLCIVLVAMVEICWKELMERFK